MLFVGYGLKASALTHISMICITGKEHERKQRKVLVKYLYNRSGMTLNRNNIFSVKITGKWESRENKTGTNLIRITDVQNGVCEYNECIKVVSR